MFLSSGSAFDWKQCSVTAAVASVATYIILRRQHINITVTSSADSQIEDLRLQVLRLATRDVQTLNGKSERKSFLEAHPEYSEWANGLLAVQEANARSAPPRPSGAEPQRLYHATEADKLDVAIAAVDAGYSPNAEEELAPKFGTTPLMEACFHGRDDICRLLIEHNAWLNTQSGYGWTALHYAGQANNAGCVGLLLAAGANDKLCNAKGKTALVRAVKQEKLAIVALLSKE